MISTSLRRLGRSAALPPSGTDSPTVLGKCRTPGINGPNGVLNFSIPVTASAPSVVPW